MKKYFLASFLTFAGYAIGREGHIVGGNIAWIPHHWIFGAVLMAVPLIFRKIPKNIRIFIFLIGLGVFLSDFKDFVSLKTFEPEDVDAVRFWGVD